MFRRQLRAGPGGARQRPELPDLEAQDGEGRGHPPGGDPRGTGERALTVQRATAIAEFGGAAPPGPIGHPAAPLFFCACPAGTVGDATLALWGGSVVRRAATFGHTHPSMPAPVPLARAVPRRARHRRVGSRDAEATRPPRAVAVRFTQANRTVHKSFPFAGGGIPGYRIFRHLPIAADG